MPTPAQPWPRRCLERVVNERDELDSYLGTDYLTSVRDGVLYVWLYRRAAPCWRLL